MICGNMALFWELFALSHDCIEKLRLGGGGSVLDCKWGAKATVLMPFCILKKNPNMLAA